MYCNRSLYWLRAVMWSYRLSRQEKIKKVALPIALMIPPLRYEHKQAVFLSSISSWLSATTATVNVAYICTPTMSRRSHGRCTE